MSRFGLSPGVSFFIREKDIGFDLSAIKGYQRIRTEELILFAKNQLKLQPRDIRSVQVHPVGPYAFIGFCDVEKMRDLYDNSDNLDSNTMAKKLGIHPFVARKNLYLVKRFNWKKLTQIHHKLLEIDKKTKTGLADQSLLIDLFVFES